MNTHLPYYRHPFVAGSLCLVAASLLSACGGGSAGTGAAPAAPAARQLATTSTAGTTVPSMADTTSVPTRVMENLGRGVVAVRTAANNVFVSWRLLGLEPQGIGFNVYRSTNGAPAVKLNAAPLTAGTNFSDTGAAKANAYSYSVRAVVDGVEQAPSAAFTLAANGPYEPVVRIPLAALPGTGYITKYLWVGDLDGDGEYDFVIDRLAPLSTENNDIGLGNQYLEAYRRDGTRLWQIDLGPSSRGTYNISPGAATLSIGMLDGVTVADLNGDNRAEVILKVADGVVFPNGSKFADANPEQQHIAILDGLSGLPLATRPFPANWAARGRLGTQLGVGSVDGVHPSIFFWGRNRNANKSFNDVFASWSWNGGTSINENWVMAIDESGVTRASHQMRLIDLDGDGKDEFATGNFVVNSNGTLRYTLPGVIHGDRFYIGKFDKDHTGMRGYGVQQNNPSGLLDYYYDATNGNLLWTHNTTPGTLVDVGRGIVGDIDPAHPGYEVWAYSGGVYNGPTNTLTSNTESNPWPNQQIWWDGDLLSEQLGTTTINKWVPTTNNMQRVLTMYHSGCAWNGMDNPQFFGDILGDWRTEVTCVNAANTELLIYTTNIPSSTRLYTMAHNPAYRNHMSIKGYMQSPLPDYYLGADMAPPPQPNIRYAGGTVQAEHAQLANGTLSKSQNNGYRGGGYADFPLTGGSLQFNYVDGGNGGTRNITLRYANGSSAARNGVLRVNGISTPIAFPSTGGWTNWASLTLALPMTAGLTNTVRIESSGQDLANIDELVMN